MIAVRKDIKGPHPYRKLAEYIAAAKEQGEKLDALWIVNAQAGQDPEALDWAIEEIEAQQALNTRVKSSKSYHLIVSFRDEKPSPEALRDMERHFAEALGFADHPRVVGTHANTENFHMHMAYSRIHPETYKAHWPSHDFRELEKTCRAMERKHGLKIDLCKADKAHPPLGPKAARDKEAHTWEQSFLGYVLEHKPALMRAMDKAQGWQNLHDAFARHGLMLKKRGNGLVIGTLPTERTDKPRFIKSSSLDRAFSKARLEQRLGFFQSADRHKPVRPAHLYGPKPISRHPRQDRLWRRYMATQAKRSSLANAAFRNWKEFLLYEALSDPLAMAIIRHRKGVLRDATWAQLCTSRRVAIKITERKTTQRTRTQPNLTP